MFDSLCLVMAFMCGFVIAVNDSWSRWVLWWFSVALFRVVRAEIGRLCILWVCGFRRWPGGFD